MTERDEMGPPVPETEVEPALWEKVLFIVLFLGLIAVTITTWPAVPKAIGAFLLGILEFIGVVLSLMR